VFAKDIVTECSVHIAASRTGRLGNVWHVTGPRDFKSKHQYNVLPHFGDCGGTGFLVIEVPNVTIISAIDYGRT
jgi:hypothetical protein